MDDLTITRLCSEAMGITIRWNEYLRLFQTGETAIDIRYYDPLHDDAQAMTLVKKFGIRIAQPTRGRWIAAIPSESATEAYSSFDGSLNRAICECVAKMRSESHGESK